MRRFSVSRLIAVVVVITVIIFLILSSYEQLRGFISSNAVEVENMKNALHPIYSEINGEALVLSVPVPSPATGTLEKLAGNYTFVNKGDLIGRIKSSEYTYDILSPDNGVLLWFGFNKYFKSLQDMERFKENLQFTETGKDVEKGSFVCSIINNDFALVRTDSRDTKKSEKITFDLDGNYIDGKLVFSTSEYNYYRVSEFVKYFLFKERFSLLNGFKRGIVVNKKVVANMNGEYGLFTVQGNVIKFIPGKIQNLDKDKVLVELVGIDANSVTVILTPHIVRNGEIFNG